MIRLADDYFILFYLFFNLMSLLVFGGLWAVGIEAKVAQLHKL